MGIAAGELNRRGTLEVLTDADDATGDEAEGWAAVFPECWAAIEPLTGSEKWLGERLLAENSVRIRVRCRPGVTVQPTATRKYRFVSGGRTYHVGAVLPMGFQADEWWLLAAER